jgi:phosphatidylglycerol---prolipoprotein diacylglyceryl transferase
MIIHNFDPVIVDFGIFQLRWYSLAYILGITMGWMYALKIIESTTVNKFNFIQITKSQFDELIVYIVVGLILGGRLGYVLFYNLDFYISNYLEVLKIWQGGMSFHGGLLGVIIATLIFSKKSNNNFFKFSDIISCVAPIGIFLGRIANFINGELYGKFSTLPWAVIFPNTGGFARHPSQIYEAALEGLILFILINYLALKKNFLFKPGYISCFFLVLYSCFRLLSESFREPDVHLGYFFNHFSMGTLLSFATLIAGLLIFFIIKKNEQIN